MTNSTDFEDLLEHANLGKEASDHYMARLDALDNIVRECIHASHGYGGIPAPTSRHFYASVLFTSLITKGVSLISLAPHSQWAAKQIEHWDYATAAVIARTMLEVRLAYYYLCTDLCSDEEWQCRWNVFNLHDCTSRRRMFEAIGETDQVAGFDQQGDELRDHLKANVFFNALPAGQQKKLLNGQTAYLMPLEDIAERAGLEKETFRYLYVLLSSHVHSLPMSFYRMGGDEADRGRGLPSPVEEHYTSLCLSLACSLLTHTRDEVYALFAGIAKQEKQPDPELAEEKIVEALAQPDKFAVGETAEVFQSNEIRLEVKRVSKDNFEIVYYHSPSGAIVLRRVVGADVYLQDIDPFFWSVELNGEAATESLIEQAGKAPYAFKIDHISRKLTFKTER